MGALQARSVDLSMTAAFKAVLAQALELPDEERSELAAQLLRSLVPDGDSLTEEEWDAAWSTEINRRLAAIRSGEAELVDGDEVLAELPAIAERP